MAKELGTIEATLYDIEMLRRTINGVLEKVMEQSVIIFNRLEKQDKIIAEQNEIIKQIVQRLGPYQ